eukprot:scaffold903_cov262-Pinguiococcus_pyrenoidosus.AAC.19
MPSLQARPSVLHDHPLFPRPGVRGQAFSWRLATPCRLSHCRLRTQEWEAARFVHETKELSARRRAGRRREKEVEKNGAVAAGLQYSGAPDPSSAAEPRTGRWMIRDQTLCDLFKRYAAKFVTVPASSLPLLWFRSPQNPISQQTPGQQGCIAQGSDLRNLSMGLPSLC